MMRCVQYSMIAAVVVAPLATATPRRWCRAKAAPGTRHGGTASAAAGSVTHHFLSPAPMGAVVSSMGVACRSSGLNDHVTGACPAGRRPCVT